MRQHFFVGRGLGTRPLHLVFELAVGQNLVRLGLLASAIDLEIAQDERSLAILLEKNKGIGREEARRVKHVRVILAGRDDQARFVFAFAFGGILLLEWNEWSSTAFLRTSSCRRKIQWSSQSRRRLDPISTAVLKVKTLTVDALRAEVIAFFCAEKHIRLSASAVIVLFHLRVRDQVGNFLVYVELFGRDRAVRVLESRAIEGHFSAQNLIDDDQILLRARAGFALPDRKARRAFPSSHRAASDRPGVTRAARRWRRSAPARRPGVSSGDSASPGPRPSPHKTSASRRTRR